MQIPEPAIGQIIKRGIGFTGNVAGMVRARFNLMRAEQASQVDGAFSAAETRSKDYFEELGKRNDYWTFQEQTEKFLEKNREENRSTITFPLAQEEFDARYDEIVVDLTEKVSRLRQLKGIEEINDTYGVILDKQKRDGDVEGVEETLLTRLNLNLITRNQYEEERNGYYTEEGNWVPGAIEQAWVGRIRAEVSAMPPEAATEWLSNADNVLELSPDTVKEIRQEVWNNYTHANTIAKQRVEEGYTNGLIKYLENEAAGKGPKNKEQLNDYGMRPETTRTIANQMDTDAANAEAKIATEQEEAVQTALITEIQNAFSNVKNMDSQALEDLKYSISLITDSQRRKFYEEKLTQAETDKATAETERLATVAEVEGRPVEARRLQKEANDKKEKAREDRRYTDAKEEMWTLFDNKTLTQDWINDNQYMKTDPELREEGYRLVSTLQDEREKGEEEATKKADEVAYNAAWVEIRSKYLNHKFTTKQVQAAIEKGMTAIPPKELLNWETTKMPNRYRVVGDLPTRQAYARVESFFKRLSESAKGTSELNVNSAWEAMVELSLAEYVDSEEYRGLDDFDKPRKLQLYLTALLSEPTKGILERGAEFVNTVAEEVGGFFFGKEATVKNAFDSLQDIQGATQDEATTNVIKSALLGQQQTAYANSNIGPGGQFTYWFEEIPEAEMGAIKADEGTTFLINKPAVFGEDAVLFTMNGDGKWFIKEPGDTEWKKWDQRKAKKWIEMYDSVPTVERTR